MNQLNQNVATITSKNWLDAPSNREAFRKVEDVLSVVEVSNDPENKDAFEQLLVDPERLTLLNSDSAAVDIERVLESTYTDGFIVLRDGHISYEWYAPGQSISDKHIVFSVTKSLVGSLVGILVDQGLIDTQAFVPQYVSELVGSAYDQVRVRDLLDMTVSLEFEEAYLDHDSAYARYRESTGWCQSEVDRTPLGMHQFLAQIPPGNEPHGTRFDYLSVNSDVLGWVCERAAKDTLASLISSLIWKPMRAESSAYITVDRFGAPRAAGGFGCTLRDMARFGECMRNGGALGGSQIIPRSWVESTTGLGDGSAWKNGAMADWIPGGGYKNQWWLANDSNGAYFAAGIYGHWIYIAPARGVVIVKQSSRPQGPASKEEFQFDLSVFERVAKLVS